MLSLGQTDWPTGHEVVHHAARSVATRRDAAELCGGPRRGPHPLASAPRPSPPCSIRRSTPASAPSPSHGGTGAGRGKDTPAGLKVVGHDKG